MAVIFSANSVVEQDQKLLTGGLFDRLKGMSAYLTLCKYFDVDGTVIWDDPYRAEKIFEPGSKVAFRTRDVLEPWSTWNTLNLLHKRPESASLRGLREKFASEALFVMFSNKPLVPTAWPSVCREITSEAGGWLVNGNEPEHVLFDENRLRFRTSKYVVARTPGVQRITFHIRVGGEGEGWKDPVLDNPTTVERCIAEILESISSLGEAHSLQIGIVGDHGGVKRAVWERAECLGLQPIGDAGSVVHLDRSANIEPESHEVLLRDINLISTSDFVFTTHGAFGSGAAKYGCKPYGKVDKASALESCLRLLNE